MTDSAASGTDTTEEIIEDKVTEANRIFDSIDKDGNGEISNDELRLHLEKNGFSADSIRNLFTALDKNADGAISREEMQFAFYNYETTALYMAFGVTNDQVSTESYDDAVSFIRSSARTYSSIRSNNDKYADALLVKLADLIFDMIDTDQSGEIDASELQEHFQQGSGKATVRETGNSSLISANSIFKALDLNSDGRISREEMRAGFKQYDPLVLSKALGLRVARTSEV